MAEETVTEHVGLTHNEIGLIRTTIYSTLAMGVIAGPEDMTYELTEKGADELVTVYEKLALIELTDVK